ncbi:MAG: hypothetical protein ACYSUX_11690 [Planctomycetota bacterium]|jgi:hypothetical protein
MKSHYDSIKTKVLTVTMAILLTVSLMGCGDTIVADMEAEHIQLGNMCQQELRQCRAAYSSGSKTEALFPAP